MQVHKAAAIMLSVLVGLALLTSVSNAGRGPRGARAGTTVFVDWNSPGPAHDGTSWDSAYLTIQAGINAATADDEVWVADGTYNEDLTVKAGVAVYGGFLGAELGGYEGSLAERDFVNHVTTIQGTHTKSVVTMPSGADATTRLDGFTITDGSATSGGGVVCTNSSPTIANCIFTANQATNGSGVYANDSSSPTLVDNTFTGNTTGYPVSVYCNMIRGRMTGNAGSGNEAGDVIEVRAGEVRTSQNWSPNPLVYRVTGDVTVRTTTINNPDAAAQLTIEPGTTVEFASGCRLVIGYYYLGSYYGALACPGELGDEVLLTGVARSAGSWEGVQFMAQTNAQLSVLDYARVEYAGQGTGADVFCESGASPTFTNCAMNGSSGYPLSVHCASAYGVQGVDGSGNASGNVIEVRGGEVKSSQTWVPNPLNFRVTGDVTVRTNTINNADAAAVLTLAAGTTIEFADACQLLIGYYYLGSYYGALVCQGASGNQVVMTGVTKTPGSWEGVYFRAQTNGSLSRMERTRVAFAGQGSNANVYCESATPAFANCFFNNSSGYPLSVHCNAAGGVEGISGSGNVAGDVIEVRTGEVTSSQTWSWNPLNYRVTGDVTVRSSTINNPGAAAVLTIAPGTTIEFADACGLIIGKYYLGDYYGALDTQGEAGNEVLFTAVTKAPGSWEGIRFMAQTNAGLTLLNQTILEYGGQVYNANVYCEALAVPTFVDCLMNSSSGYPLSVPCNSARGAQGVDGTGNLAGDVIEIRGGEVTTTQTWGSNPIDYRVTGDVVVRSTTINNKSAATVLTIAAGTVVQFQSDRGLIIGKYYLGDYFGALVCAGESGNEVLLTAETKEPGNWEGVHFLEQTNGDLSRIEHTQVEYAGQVYSANVFCETATPAFADCTFDNSSGFPLSVHCNYAGGVQEISGTGNEAGDAIEIRGGYVTTSQTWIPNPLVFRATGDVTVRSATINNYDAAAVLTIAPGTTVEFETGCGLIVGYYYLGRYYGALVCQGDPGNPALLTGVAKDPGSWEGVHFVDETNGTLSRIDQTQVEYAGQSTNANVYCDSTIPVFGECVLNDSSGHPLSVLPNAVGGVHGVSGAGNVAGDVIEIRAGDVTTSQTWSPNPLIFRATGDVTVRSATINNLNAAAVLAIAAGTTVEFAGNCGLYVGRYNLGRYHGALVCQGEPGNEVLLTAVTRDPGNWEGVRFQPEAYGARSRVEYTRIEYAGQTNLANVYCQSSDPTLANCTLALGSGYGAYCTASNALISGCAIQGNANSGVYITGASPRVTNCAIVDNDGASGGGVYVTAASPTIANNIVAFNASGIFKSGTGTAVLNNNCVYGNTAYDYSGLAPGSGDISEDPLLADWANGDLHIDPLSPCVDAGSNPDLGPARLYLDLDKEPRLADGDADQIAVVDIGVDEIYTTSTAVTQCPADLFAPVWVWFSIPLIPQGSADASDLLGFNARNRVYGYDDAQKIFMLYPDDFTDLGVGPSYMARLEIGQGYTPGYVGDVPEMPYEWTLPAAGWCWVGVPAIQNIHGMDLLVSKGGVVRTVHQDRTAGTSWLNWNWIFWDSANQTARIMDPTGAGDDQWLHPWYGYRVWSNTEDVTIIFP
jgi:hypothetical protein